MSNGPGSSTTVFGACIIAVCVFATPEARAQVEYVRVCSIYGSGYYYIPGNDICLRVGGYVRPDQPRVQRAGRAAEPATARATDGAQWVRSFNAQFLAYLGETNAYSFGSGYDTSLFGGRAAGGVVFPNYVRLQGTIQGETTGSYCPACQDSSYLAGGFNLDWNIISNVDIGVFGGRVGVNPTFSTPRSQFTYYGFEGRYFRKDWMVGGQIGRFELSNGPGTGTMTDFTFAEGRLRFSLGGMLNIAPLQNLVVGANLGQASGNLGTSSVSADSTYWRLLLDYRFSGTSISTFFNYDGFKNRTGTSGTVWEEHIFKGGVKVDLGDPGAAVPIEPIIPQPTALQVLYKF